MPSVLEEGQRVFDEHLDSSTNMKHRLLIGWLLQVDLDGGPYLRETHVAGRTISISKLRNETEFMNIQLQVGVVGKGGEGKGERGEGEL